MSFDFETNLDLCVFGVTDIGSKAAMGGLAREFYERIHNFYASPENWMWGSQSQAEASYQSTPDSIAKQKGWATRWTFEPSAAAKVFAQMLAEANVQVRHCGPLVSVEKFGGQIVAIVSGDGSVIKARNFVDATYDANQRDCLSHAGVGIRHPSAMDSGGAVPIPGRRKKLDPPVVRK